MVAISLTSRAFATLPLEHVAARLANDGYDGIDLFVCPRHVTLEQCAAAPARARLKRLLSEQGLEVAGYHADFTGVNPLSEGAEQPYRTLFQRHLELCVELGSPSITVNTTARTGSVDEWEYHRGFERLVTLWTRTAEACAKAGIAQLWEFEPGLVFSRPSEVITMHRRVDHSSFHILFNTAHAYVCGTGHRDLPGGLPEFLKKLEGRIGAIRIGDTDGKMSKSGAPNRRPLGEGTIDFRALAPQLIDADVRWWSVDLCTCPSAWDLIGSSRDFVLDLLNSRTAA
jgi:sugar phosphate isomerase/epimerase